MKYTFKPGILMTLTTLVVMAICIKLGLWQYNKAEAKTALQAQLEKSLKETPIALPQAVEDIEAWRYRRVKFAGTYEPRYQVLLDNQVENTAAGYHVLTPVKIEGNNQYVLVNRGWVPGTPDRKVPEIRSPDGQHDIEGDIAFPSARFFTLESPPPTDGKWQEVWQNMDMQRYAKSVPFTIRPFVVRLDSRSEAGGFLRNWPPPGERITTHLGYAYQWFGFALTLFIIYIVLNVKKVELK